MVRQFLKHWKGKTSKTVVFCLSYTCPFCGKQRIMKHAFLAALALSLCLSASPVTAKGKVWTIDARQAQLMIDINEGQKGKQLTKKEADSLRSDLADVARKKKKMKTKAEDGNLTDANKSDLEADLNKISVAIKKYKLEKRVEKN